MDGFSSSVVSRDKKRTTRLLDRPDVRRFAGDGLGVVYWEPAWVSSRCKHSDSDSAGSSWENATFFTFDRNNVHEGADFLGYDYGDLGDSVESLQ